MSMREWHSVIVQTLITERLNMTWVLQLRLLNQVRVDSPNSNSTQKEDMIALHIED